MHSIRLEIDPSKIAFGPCHLENLDKTHVAIDHCYRLDSFIRHRFRKSSIFARSHVVTRRRFLKPPLWRAFSKNSVFGGRNHP